MYKWCNAQGQEASVGMATETATHPTQQSIKRISKSFRKSPIKKQTDDPPLNEKINHSKVSTFSKTSKLSKPSKSSLSNIDSVKLISRYLNYPHADLEYYTDSKERSNHIDIWLREYHSQEVTEDRRVYLRKCIIINLWYLFPYILTSYHFKFRIFDDALQNLVIVIMNAIDKFDPSRGTKFTAYITGYIKNAICATIKNESLIKVPAAATIPQMVYLRAMAAEDEDTNTSCTMVDSDDDDGIGEVTTGCSTGTSTNNNWSAAYDNDDEQITDDTPRPVKSAKPQRVYQRSFYNITSVDYDEYDNDGAEVSNRVGRFEVTELTPDIIANKNTPDAVIVKNAEMVLLDKEKVAMLKQVLSHPKLLTEKEKLVLSLRYGLEQSTPKTLVQVSNIMRSTGYKATKEWVFQIEHKARRKIYNYFKEHNLLHLVE